MNQEIKYKVVYRNGDKFPVHIANFWRTPATRFVFEYVENPPYYFPGLDPKKSRHESDHVWEQISFRVPNYVRNLNPNVPVEELLQKTEGKLVTDHFEFLKVR